MKTNKILISLLLTVYILSSCNEKEVAPKSIDRHAVNAFLIEYFEDNGPAHSHSSEGFLRAFNQEFDTDYSQQTIDDYGSAYRKTMQSKGVNTALSADDSEFDITELEGIEGYDYFHALYNYETSPVNLDDLVTKALIDNRLSEEAASYILSLIYLKRLILTQIEQTGVTSSQCPDTPGNAQCMQGCESEYSRSSKINFGLTLGSAGWALGWGAAIGGPLAPVSMGIGLVGSVGVGLIGQAVVFTDYQQCVYDCNRTYPCQ